MNYLKTLKLGSLLLPSNILYAPLAGCSDYPFRKMVTPYRPGLFFCEMVKMDAIVRHDSGTYRLLNFDQSMHPIGAQLCGSKPALAKQAARIIEDLGFDVLDLNCGCPVDKVTKDGSGSGLLKNPELIGEILHEMVQAVKIPVTVKIRMGWDEKEIVAPKIALIAEKAGAKLITIHGRTRSQGYKGVANWDPIREAKQATSSIHVIGNGDIVDGPSAAACFSQTGCDGILIGRATMGQPWIVDQITTYLQTGIQPLKTSLDYRDALLKHLKITVAYEHNRNALIAMRRVGCWYLRQGRGTKALREAINSASNLSDIHALIEGYSWHDTEFVPTPNEESCITC